MFLFKVVKEVERTTVENLKCGWLKEVIVELEHLLKNKMINYDVKPAYCIQHWRLRYSTEKQLFLFHMNF